MTIRSQVDPYVLVGLLADLPSPAAIAQGTLFHAEDTGDCLVLVINPLSHTRYWEPFCGTSGASGSNVDLLLKFSGVIQPNSSIFLGDSGDTVLTAGIGQAREYVIPFNCIAQQFNIFVVNGTPSGTTVLVTKNTIPVVGMGVALTVGSIHTVTPMPGTGAFAPGDRLDVFVGYPIGAAGNLVLSVTGVLAVA